MTGKPLIDAGKDEEGMFDFWTPIPITFPRLQKPDSGRFPHAGRCTDFGSAYSGHEIQMHLQLEPASTKPDRVPVTKQFDLGSCETLDSASMAEELNFVFIAFF